jgi:hypothetical protein
MDPSKYRPISLPNMRGKVLEELLINTTNHHMYTHNLLTDRQFGFTHQKSTTDARGYGGKILYKTGTGEQRLGHNDQGGCQGCL